MVVGPVREEAQGRGCRDPTPHSGVVARTVEGGLVRQRGKTSSPRLGFESRKEKRRRRGTGERFADP